jgi:hypothetical protein
VIRILKADAPTAFGLPESRPGGQSQNYFRRQHNREDGFFALIGLFERDKTLWDRDLQGIALRSYIRFTAGSAKCAEISTTFL